MPIYVGSQNIKGSASGITFNDSSVFDATGRQTIPTLPAFSGRRTGTQSAGNEYPWSVNTIDINIGNCWTSNNTFTAPIPGVYFASLSLIFEGNTHSGYVSIIKNGAMFVYTYGGTKDAWDTMNVAALISCQVGDTIRFAVNTAPGVAGGNSLGAYRDEHNMATIWLLG